MRALDPYAPAVDASLCHWLEVVDVPGKGKCVRALRHLAPNMVIGLYVVSWVGTAHELGQLPRADRLIMDQYAVRLLSRYIPPQHTILFLRLFLSAHDAIVTPL